MSVSISLVEPCDTKPMLELNQEPLMGNVSTAGSK